MKDLNAIINKLKNHSAPGHDEIHNLMIKYSTVEFKKIILELINLTVNNSTLPHQWKCSIVKMIPKKKSNSSDPKDYRPFSLTSEKLKN